MASWTEQLEHDARVLRVRFGDGSVITFRVEWCGGLNASVREDGRPATFTHPFDDRRCLWEADGFIVRQVIAVIGGQDDVKQHLTKVFKTSNAGEGSSFVLTNLRPENCNDCQARRESDFQDVRNAVNDSVQGMIASDLEAVKDQMRALNDMIEITGPN